MSLLTRAVDLIRRSLPASAGGWVTIRRGELSCRFACGYGKPQSAIDTGSGTMVVAWDGLDLTAVASADYDFGDGPVDPEQGDLVELDERSGDVFEVLSPSQGDNSTRWMDPLGTLLRVHTKRVQSA